MTWKKNPFVLGVSNDCNHLVEGNMRIKCGVILAVIGYITFFSSMQGWGTDWKFYESNEEGTYFYDTEAVRQVSKDIIQVWTKRVFPPEKEMQNDN